MKPFPELICINCSNAFGKPRFPASTWHKGTCEVCGRDDVSITESRDFKLKLSPEFEEKKIDVPEFFKDIFK